MFSRANMYEEETKNARRRHPKEPLLALLLGARVLRAQDAVLALDTRNVLAREVDRLGRVENFEDFGAGEEPCICAIGLRKRQRARDRGEVAAERQEEKAPSSSLSKSVRITCPSFAIPQHPNIKLLGYGHGWLEWYPTSPTTTPASSYTSRRTASSRDSPDSMKPARHE